MAKTNNGRSTPFVAARRRTLRAFRRGLHRGSRRIRTLAEDQFQDADPSPPDFVGVGAQRAGTSWWYSLIEAHPDVVRLRGAPKELHYFDPFWEREFGDAEIRAYHEHFRRPHGRLIGEWTPRYMFDPWTPPLLCRAAPATKILVMLRDPVERLRSGLAHRIERGWVVNEGIVNEHVARGLYDEQLTRLLDYFPKEQILVLQLERCRAEPRRLLLETLSFLGLPEPQLDDAVIGRRVNAARETTVTLSDAFVNELRLRYAPGNRRLAQEFAGIDLSLWPSMRSI